MKLIVLFFSCSLLALNAQKSQKNISGKLSYIESFNNSTKFEYDLIFTPQTSFYVRNIEGGAEVFSIGGHTQELIIPKYFVDIDDIERIKVAQEIAEQEVRYEETTKIEWEIFDEFKEIENFICKKARTKFKGVNYEVWFTESIKLPFGPWKLRGLPGLIIEAYDLSNYYHIKATQISLDFTIDGEERHDDIINKNIFKPDTSYKDVVYMIKNEDKIIESHYKSILGRDEYVEIYSEPGFRREIFD